MVDEALDAPPVVLEEEQEVEEEEPEETRPEPTPKQITVMVVKPDAVAAGKVEEIIQQVSVTVTHMYMYVSTLMVYC